jgi:P27 family predicted phage terminase small subunit
MLTAVDIASLAYCAAYARWRTAEEVLAREAKADPASAALTVEDAAGTVRTNPLVRIARNAAAEMMRHAAQFGLTPAARSRIAAGGQPGRVNSTAF